MSENTELTRAEQVAEVKQLSDWLLSLSPQDFGRGWATAEGWNSCIESDDPRVNLPGGDELTGFAAEVAGFLAQEPDAE